MADEANVLAIDTASPNPAVALLSGGKVFEESLPADRRASENLLPALRRCLERAHVGLERVTRLALCAGPGSFTGLRVGLATAWGLSRSASLPLEAVSTLEAMAEAWRAPGKRTVWAALDAGRGETIFQQFDLEGPRASARGLPARATVAEALRATGHGELVALPAGLLRADGPPLPRSPAHALALAAARSPRPMATGPTAAIYSRASAAEEKHGAA